MKNLFPWAMVVMQVGAMVSELWLGGTWKAVYWLGGAILTFAVIMMR